MLRNELSIFQDPGSLPEGGVCAALIELTPGICARVRRSWEDAVLSEAPEHILVRYFHYQLDSVFAIANSYYKCGNKTEEPAWQLIVNLIDHLHVYYSCYFNCKAISPDLYRLHVSKQLKSKVDLVKNGLNTMNDAALGDMFLKYLNHAGCLDQSIKLSFQNLDYFIRLINNLAGIDYSLGNAEELFLNELFQSNFNHLSFFVYLQQQLSTKQEQALNPAEKLTTMREQQAAICSRPVIATLIYDEAWPSLKTMLGCWLEEAIHFTEQSIDDALKNGESIFPKIPVELPVAHFAYLTHLFVDENIFGNQNLKVLFRFFADHFQTKRQPAISPGGFSKAYYSADQQTAARVRALLEKMLTRIKRDFFPVMVAVSITAHFYPGMH
ncbi:hypothetical protein [Mucilaginibacter jinjuensis]|uniref:Uncharacterized protein n=1 Tax=Mucilaginibacter jinjuensis TaxID=1176721 RepID=A0ABY7TD43_9SPHI|nr:hypothetical protein [Mucilaginibacter jinjuensis]WCT14435.1 hypothetical protein PQO05_10875 [Mucilaginibacter jinjuensis]